MFEVSKWVMGKILFGDPTFKGVPPVIFLLTHQQGRMVFLSSYSRTHSIVYLEYRWGEMWKGSSSQMTLEVGFSVIPTGLKIKLTWFEYEELFSIL